MNRNEASKLQVGVRVRAKLYAASWVSGTVIESLLYSKGVRFDGYTYLNTDDCHGFSGMSARLLESLEVIK